uniref:ATP synthase complex subunit 8 n=1 Tax=Leiopelma hamiltoni TaxID=43508 RepID=A0A0F6NDY2_LEIHA|nr:ATP synthase F0 subunit 8 [Leiopelma hamiltoni]
MPQLNPGPWLITLIFSWLILTIVLPPKMINHQPINEPTKNHKKTLPCPWPWPWT